MAEQSAFYERIRQRYPEGLTGIIAIGGTRTTYILEHNRQSPNPGQIRDFEHYADTMLTAYLRLIVDYYALGGQNLIIPPLAYQRFQNRGEEYAQYISKLTLRLVEGEMVQFYQDHQIDPYFTGIDTLVHLPDRHVAHELGVQIADFQRHWDYQAGRRKLIWEIAPIPLFSFFSAREALGDDAYRELAVEINTAQDMNRMQELVYEYYARAVYGTVLPFPHFYIGSNRNGDLKPRAIAPFALYSGENIRLYFTPYPSLFMTREALRAILEDVAFGETLSSYKTDYDNQYTPAMAEAEYQRIMKLRDDPQSTIGLTRRIEAQPVDDTHDASD